jgi:hypothetical protein
VEPAIWVQHLCCLHRILVVPLKNCGPAHTHLAPAQRHSSITLGVRQGGGLWRFAGTTPSSSDWEGGGNPWNTVGLRTHTSSLESSTQTQQHYVGGEGKQPLCESTCAVARCWMLLEGRRQNSNLCGSASITAHVPRCKRVAPVSTQCMPYGSAKTQPCHSQWPAAHPGYGWSDDM